MAKKASRPEDLPEGDALRTALIEQQFWFHSEATHGLVILLSGMLMSDVESAISHLNGRMDPRNIRVHALDAGSDPLDRMELKLYPAARRFALRLPRRGEISLFLDGWYHFLLDPRLAKPKGFDAMLSRRLRYERFLTEEHVTVLKVWLDRSKEDLEARIDDLDKSPLTRWQISNRDRRIAADYKKYRKRIDPCFRNSKSNCGWTIIDMGEKGEKNSGLDRLGHIILEALKSPPQKTDKPMALPPRSPDAPAFLKADAEPPKVRKTDDADTLLREAQRRLRALTESKPFRNRAMVIALEGHDAAGKGGTIRRLVHGIDPRRRNVVPIAAPTDDEALHHYLWRFWRDLPPIGDVTIFDRSWYGRVLVERVEEITSPDDWQRAYTEINDFESEICRHGIILTKIWLDVSLAEQGRRFAEREETPWKRYKLTPDDLRNRSKRQSYEKALEDMLAYTHTELAPWTVIPSDDKPMARIQTLTVIADRLEQALK